jgi:hypothetical protein
MTELERLRAEVADLRHANEGLGECITAFNEGADLLMEGLTQFVDGFADQPELQARAAAAVAASTSRFAALMDRIAQRFPRSLQH